MSTQERMERSLRLWRIVTRYASLVAAGLLIAGGVIFSLSPVAAVIVTGGGTLALGVAGGLRWVLNSLDGYELRLARPEFTHHRNEKVLAR